MSTTTDHPTNVASALVDTLIASNLGDRDAFGYNGKRYSYQDVAALMNRAGNLVRALGVPEGASVLLLLPPSPAFVGSLLGAMKAGAVPLVGAPEEADVLTRCIDATRPAAAIVHESRLRGASHALAALSRESVVVVGAETHGHPSFVEAMRTQPSWLAPGPTAADAPALRIWTGSGVEEISHADLAHRVQADAAETATAPLAASAVAASVVGMLRAFSRGEQAMLG